jgi:hypothetical protein
VTFNKFYLAILAIAITSMGYQINFYSDGGCGDYIGYSGQLDDNILLPHCGTMPSNTNSFLIVCGSDGTGTGSDFFVGTGCHSSEAYTGLSCAGNGAPWEVSDNQVCFGAWGLGIRSYDVTVGG